MAAADHLTVPRQHGLFLHHGIDLGDGSVAHYLEGREILRSPLNDFSRGLEICVVNHPQASSAGITLRRAMSRIGEQRYNLLFNNCEHFATWCKTGRHRSGQVEDWLHTSSLGALALGQLMPAALLTGLRLLLRKGLMDQASRERARRGLAQLEQLRLRLLQKLETTLEQAESWIRGGPDNGAAARGNRQSRRLLQAGQTLADELAAVEEMEQRIAALLEGSPGKEDSEPG
ncbi:MAG: lecithin retinol acyltransferase family protein [Vulcanococcus sp.]